MAIWHTLDSEKIFEKLKTGTEGLSGEEAERRLQESGPNKLPEAKVESIWLILLRQFENPLIYILLIAGIVVFLTGEAIDSIVITAVLIFNAAVGAIQEGRARDTLLALRTFVSTKAVVIRGGRELIIQDFEVVPGDIILIQEGEKIPADARIISSRNLKAEEAALTGESAAVHKHAHAIGNPDTPILERKNMVFKGTAVASGRGLAVVVATGVDTVIGGIAKEVAAVDTDIPLKKDIKSLSKIFIISTAVICVVIFVAGILYGYSAREMFSMSVSMAVSAIPSGLPIALTIILASGVWRMSKRNALVKRLQAVEALGQAKIIAVDKTGTITKNEMMAALIFINGKTFEIGGVGYEPKGEARLNGELVSIEEDRDLAKAAALATLCSNGRAMYSEESHEWRVAGDPTEAALFVLGAKLGFDKDDLENSVPLISEIPFDFSLKYHATLHKTGKKGTLTVIGAPESVLSLCTKIFSGGKTKKMSKTEKEEIAHKVLELSRKGLRVLACAELKMDLKDISKDDVNNLSFVGFYGLKDALRPEVKTATMRAQNAGLKVVMITGDHKETAIALAREAGIYKNGDIALTGADIENLNEYELKDIVGEVSVFSRVTPEHKLRIINAYRARGEIVAMTGDGVNDAPSLVAADLGVAMGKVGTEVAKEASDIVLLDDNFGSIVSAIEEGRGIYKTIKKVIVYLVSTSIGEASVILIALFAGLPLPLLPAQIIWLNFITDGFFIPALALEPREKNLLKAKFEKNSKYMIDPPMARRMFLMAAPMVIFSLLLFILTHESSMAKASTLALTLLAVFQWMNAWNSRSETESVFKESPFTNWWLIGGTAVAVVFQLLAVYNPFFQSFLRTVPLSVTDWLIIIALSFSIIIVEEIRKSFARNRKDAEPIKSSPVVLESI